MRKRKSIFLCVLLTASVLCGCSKKDSEVVSDNSSQVLDVQAEISNEIYSPKSIVLEVEPFSYAKVKSVGDFLYYFATQDDENKSGYSFYKYSIQDGSTKAITEIIEGDKYPNEFAIGADGNIYCVHYEQGTDMLFTKYDAAGREVISTDLRKSIPNFSSNPPGNVISVLADINDKISIICEKKILIFDRDGNYLDALSPCDGKQDAKIESGGIGADEKIYLVLSDNSGEHLSKPLLEIDLESKAFNTLVKNIDQEGPIVPGINGTILMNSPSDAVLYDFDREAKVKRSLFSWKDYGFMESRNEQLYSLGVSSDGSIIAVLVDWSAGKKSAVLFSKAASEKKELVIGIVQMDPLIQNYASAFNQVSDKYHVTVRDYMDGQEYSDELYDETWDKMNIELAAGKGPDIISLANAPKSLLPSLAKQGFVTDLEPYLEKSSTLSKDDFVGSVLDGAKFEGKLIALPKDFQILAVVGNKDIVGVNTGWTSDDFVTMVESHPGQSALYDQTKENLLAFCTRYNLDAFMNSETKECAFNSEAFISLLEMANRYGTINSGEDYGESAGDRVKRGDLLLVESFLLQFGQIKNYDRIFDGNENIIGYPVADGGSGNIISINKMCGISANSKCKEGAWEFLEFMVNVKSNEYGWWSFPALKSILEENMRYEMEVKDDDSQITNDQAERIMDVILNAQPEPVINSKINEIIQEETVYLFEGTKSAKQVADVIQNRVRLYLNEL